MNSGAFDTAEKTLGFVLTPAAQQEILQLVNSNPAMVKYHDAMLRGPLATGLRYQSIRMAKAVVAIKLLRDQQD